MTSRIPPRIGIFMSPLARYVTRGGEPGQSTISCFLGGAAGAQEGLDLVGGAGRGEEIALAHAAAAVGEELALRVVLDAFRDHLEIQAAGERDEGAREPRALAVARHAGDELPVDAYRVDVQ